MRAFINNLIKKFFIFFGYRISKIGEIKELEFFFNIIKVYKTNLIRIGNSNDGGYLLPNDLEGIKYCYSPGTSNSYSFEKELSESYKIKSFMADYSVNHTFKDDNMHFIKKHIGVFSSEKYIEINEWIKDIELNNSILQMDIEGSEYSVLNKLEEEKLSKFRVLIIEFHDLDSLIDKNFNGIIYSIFEKILKYFYIVHIHPNNIYSPIRIGNFNIPPVMEFTFHNKNRYSETPTLQNEFPHPLDFYNKQTFIYKKYDLPECWR